MSTSTFYVQVNGLKVEQDNCVVNNFDGTTNFSLTISAPKMVRSSSLSRIAADKLSEMFPCSAISYRAMRIGSAQ